MESQKNQKTENEHFPSRKAVACRYRAEGEHWNLQVHLNTANDLVYFYKWTDNRWIGKTLLSYNFCLIL